MNFSILIFACVLVLQIEKHECNFAKAYPTCDKTKNGKGCLAWSFSALCSVEPNAICQNVCWPDFFHDVTV